MGEWPDPTMPPGYGYGYQPPTTPDDDAPTFPLYGRQSQPTWQDEEAWQAPDRLSKPAALRRLRALKRGILAGTVVAFGALIGLVASHATGVTARPSTSSSTPSTSQNPDDNGGSFFNQPPGGFGFGSGNSIQSPVSGSTTS
jgi:hypothetical protein